MLNNIVLAIALLLFYPPVMAATTIDAQAVTNQTGAFSRSTWVENTNYTTDVDLPFNNAVVIYPATIDASNYISIFSSSTATDALWNDTGLYSSLSNAEVTATISGD